MTWILLLAFLITGTFGTLQPLYNYRGTVAFDQRMFNNCMSTLSIKIDPRTIDQQDIDFEPRIPTASKFGTGCFNIGGTIDYGTIHFYTWYYCWKCQLTKAQVRSCLENRIGQKHNFSFIGVI